jgi:hypothetical protein
MCGEWEFGGLPAWLYENGTVKIRTDAEPYMSAATQYWEDQLLPQVLGSYPLIAPVVPTLVTSTLLLVLFARLLHCSTAVVALW